MKPSAKFVSAWSWWVTRRDGVHVQNRRTAYGTVDGRTVPSPGTMTMGQAENR